MSANSGTSEDRTGAGHSRQALGAHQCPVVPDGVLALGSALPFFPACDGRPSGACQARHLGARHAGALANCLRLTGRTQAPNLHDRGEIDLLVHTVLLPYAVQF
jgi:hypothetical protein